MWISFYLIDDELFGVGTVHCEVHRKNNDVRQRGYDTQGYSIAHLKWQHGVDCNDDEEEEGHLERTR